MFTQTAVTEYSKLQRGTGDEDIWNPVVGSAVSGASSPPRAPGIAHR